ncbi:MAG: hypothetical protein EOM20_01570 [Spartobacteria bacterium]|nr:hypothetical protein [Spartobacteria bacterium]
MNAEQNIEQIDKEDDVLTHQYWAVAFVDILGQKNYLKSINFIPEQSNEEQVRLFTEWIKKVYGAVEHIHDSFQNWPNQNKDPKNNPLFKDLTEEELAVARTFKTTTFQFQRFSDGLVVFISLADCKETSPIAAIFSLFSACASVLLCSLAGGTPIRGSIDVGTGVEMKKKNELYGPVMAHAG